MHDKVASGSNFIRNIVENDLKSGKHQLIITRFPPEPNGFLHIGHAKAICLNFGLAEDFVGQCNLRFDDTNPEKETTEFVEAIARDIKWLGFTWNDEIKYASDYFDKLYHFAKCFIEHGLAYVCDLTASEIRDYRGTLQESGRDSPYRNRSIQENLDLFEKMAAGLFADESKTLRLKIDMSSPNMNLRDPVIYRIKRAHHIRTQDKWCIYPMYDYTHCISDALEGITHSCCSLEFEDHRPLYDWVIDHLVSWQELDCHPRQIEFSRLELEYAMTSKRKLYKLITDGAVSGWDDPRMPTISGMRRRGYTAAGIRLFINRCGVSKSPNEVEMALLETSVREDLENVAPRVMAVLKPLKIVLTNFDELVASRSARFHPKQDNYGERMVELSREIYIDHDDFMENPVDNWQRLSPGREVRLRHSYIIKCENVIKSANGEIIELHATLDKDTLGKNPENRKVKGVIHWVSTTLSLKAKVRLYDNLFTVAKPDQFEANRDFINNNSLTEVNAYIEPGILILLPKLQNFQFERLGYFVVDSQLSTLTNLVFNKTVSLRDNWK